MADDVVIGSASVQIVGDYSGLEKSFKESQDLAQSAGLKISSALESSSEGAKTLTLTLFQTADAMTGVIKPTEDAEARLQELLKTGMTAGEAFAALQAEAAKTSAAEDQLGSSSTQAAAGVAGVGQAAAGATGPLNEAAQASNSLLDSLLGFAATAITAAALERIGSESIQAFGRMQQLTTSLDLMGAGAHGAAVKVEELKNLSIQLAVPFENLAQRAQALAAQFGTGEGLTAILIAAGNASAGAGKSFDAASSAIERIGVTGAISARQLFALGLNWQDMAESMGVSIATAQEKLKKGGQDAQQDVADVIEAINAKFGDAAERQAQNTLGVWTNLKNQAEFIFQEIGSNLDGIVEIFSGAMKVVATGLIGIVGGTQLVTVAIVGMVREGIEAIKGLGAVAVAAMSGNFVGVATAAADAYGKIKTASEYTDQSLQDHAKKTADQLLNIWSDSAKKISATFTPGGGGAEDGSLKATRDKVTGFKDASAALAVLIAQEKLEQQAWHAVILETAKFNETMGASISAQDFMAMKTAMAAEAMTSLDDAIPPTDNHLSNLEKETNKLYHTMQMLGGEVNAVEQTALDTTSWGKMDAALKMLGLSVDDLGKKSRIAKVAAAEYIAANNMDMSNVAAAWGTLNTEVNRLAKFNLPEAIKMQDELISSMQRMDAPMVLIIAEQEKELDLAIRLKTERGQSANAEIIALANMRAGTAALSTLNNTLATTYITIFHTIDQGFGQLSGAIGQIINGAGSFYKAWHAAMNQIEVQIVSALVQAVIRYGVAWVTAHVLGTAASTAHATAEMAGITATSAARAAATAAQLVQITAVTAAQTAAIATVTAEQLASFVAIRAASTALDIADVLGYAAVAGAAAFASTAAIPIVGPFLAPEAGALAYATVAATYAPLATFSEGGMVPADMIAMVHKGEYVLPAEKTAAAIVGGGGGKGEIHVHFDFGGAHFSNGLNDTQVKTVFDRAFRMSKLAGALPAGRFPQ